MRRAVALFTLAAGVLGSAPALADTVTKGPWVQRVTSNSAVVRVEVDPPSPASVTLGLGGPADLVEGGSRTFESPQPKSLHSIELTGLVPATHYNYTVNVRGAPKYAAFTTAPREDSSATFRFLVYGDNRSDDAAHAAVVRSMVPVASDFILHTGDFVENGASLPQWQAFFEIESPLLRERCVFSCVGNHELTEGQAIPYLQYFAPTDPQRAPPAADGRAPLIAPEHLDGTFRWSNARFFLLNGMVGWKSGADRAWLEQALAAADHEPGLLWRIVVVHFGPWSSGPHGGNRALHGANIPALLRSHNVDLVIAGHDHIYERGWAEGMAYLVSGGGGAPTYRIRSAAPTAKKFESVHHFVDASVSTAAIQFTAIRVDGTHIERCGLRKNVGWDCDEATSQGGTSTTAASAGASSSGSPPGGSASKCACHTVARDGRGGVGASSVLAAGLLLATLFVRRRRRAILESCDP